MRADIGQFTPRTQPLVVEAEDNPSLSPLSSSVMASTSHTLALRSGRCGLPVVAPSLRISTETNSHPATWLRVHGSSLAPPSRKDGPSCYHVAPSRGGSVSPQKRAVTTSKPMVYACSDTVCSRACKGVLTPIVTIKNLLIHNISIVS
jgi:hypothetical protein